MRAERASAFLRVFLAMVKAYARLVLLVIQISCNQHIQDGQSDVGDDEDWVHAQVAQEDLVSLNQER